MTGIPASSCPFCDSDNVMPQPLRGGRLVMCMDCGAKGPLVEVPAGTNVDDGDGRAIGAWNRRAEAPAVLTGPEAEAAIVGASRDLVTAADQVCSIIQLPALQKSADAMRAQLLMLPKAGQ